MQILLSNVNVSFNIFGNAYSNINIIINKRCKINTVPVALSEYVIKLLMIFLR